MGRFPGKFSTYLQKKKCNLQFSYSLGAPERVKRQQCSGLQGPNVVDFLFALGDKETDFPSVTQE